MINKLTGDRKYFNDGGSFTQVVDIEVDTTNQRVYICQDNGSTGDFFITDLDLNILFIHTDGGAYTRVTSVAYSENPNYIYIGQKANNNGNVIVLDRTSYQFKYAWAWGKKVNALHFLKNNGLLYIGHDSGILSYYVSTGQPTGKYNNVYFPIIDIEAVNTTNLTFNNPVYAAIDNGTSGKFIRYKSDLTIKKIISVITLYKNCSC